MASITYEELQGIDPTDSILYRAAVLFDGLLRRVKLGILVEISRLLFLGFYEDFRIFLDAIEQAEGASVNAGEFEAVWSCKLRVANKIAVLVARLESIGAASYKDTSLIHYIAGKERLEGLKLFVQATDVERQGEEILTRTKGAFLTSFAQRKLTQNQQASLLEKYKELAEVLSKPQ